MRIIYIIVAALLAGCANPNFEAGMKKADAKDYRGAYQDFQRCANEGNVDCMDNAGWSAGNMRDAETAKRWFTLAARHGSKYAIDRLAAHGWDIPPNDLEEGSDANKKTKRDTYLRSLERICDEYGFKKGTDAFASCMQREDDNHINSVNAANQAESQRWKKASCNAGNTRDCENARTTNCSKDAFGNVQCVSH